MRATFQLFVDTILRDPKPAPDLSVLTAPEIQVHRLALAARVRGGDLHVVAVAEIPVEHTLQVQLPDDVLRAELTAELPHMRRRLGHRPDIAHVFSPPFMTTLWVAEVAVRVAVPLSIATPKNPVIPRLSAFRVAEVAVNPTPYTHTYIFLFSSFFFLFSCSFLFFLKPG